MFNFGYVEESNNAFNKDYRMGLNRGTLTVAFNPNGRAGGTPRNCVDVKFDSESGLSINQRYFEPDENPYYKEPGATQNVKINSSHPDYKTAMKIVTGKLLATLTHIIKAVGVTDEMLKKAFTNPANSFEDWTKKALSLVNNTVVHEVDMFLEYEPTLGDKKQTYLQIPKNMTAGYFVIPRTQGEWSEVITETSKGKTLSYVNQNGDKHPFEKNESFMAGTKSYQQFKDAPASSKASSNEATTEDDSWG